MALSVGDKLGPYEILAPLGAGGMGEVWKARDTRLDRLVAIKISKEKFTERFEREARAVAALNHPNICTLYDVGPNYLVMEYIEGTPLQGRLPLEQVLKYAGQICDALDAAHRKNVTHRDLKPANILINRAGVKLLDFGLARLSPASGDETVTMAVMGTPAYMSPEQWEGKPGDARSDIYALACVLYEILTGKRAAQDRAAIDPPALERVLRACLEKDPDDRIQTARDVKKALLWAVEPNTEGSIIRRRTSRWWIGAASALALGFATALAIARLPRPATDNRVFRLLVNVPEEGQLVLGTNRGGLALSPDGNSAAFFASIKGKTGLWVQRLDGSDPRFIPGTESGGAPFWSPDSKTIAFFSETSTALVRVDVTGGGLLAICTTPALARGGTWTPDDQIIFGTLGNGLFRVPASGGKPVALTKLDAAHGEVGHGWPQVLPHGRILYWIQSSEAETMGVYAAALSKPSERVRLLAANASVLYSADPTGRDYLIWQQASTLVAQSFDAESLKLSGPVIAVAESVASVGISGSLSASISKNGVLLYSTSGTQTQLTWIDRMGTRIATVGLKGNYTGFRLSPNGRRAAVSLNGSGGPDLWILDLDRGVLTRLTSGHGMYVFPVWSPDGGTILFQRSPTEVFRTETRGAGTQELVRRSTFTQGPLDWSRDGRSLIYFEIAPDTNRDLWILPITGDGKPVPGAQAAPYLRTPFTEWQARFSPEPSPKWVAYQSNESGRYEIYIDSLPALGNKVRVSTEGGQYPQWGPGGSELFYVSPDYKLMSVSLKAGIGSLEPSPSRELFVLPAVDDGLSPPYEVAPDGHRFLVRAIPQSAGPQALTVLVNWPAVARSGAAAR